MYIDFTYEKSTDVNKERIVYCSFCGGTKLHHGNDDSCVGRDTHAYDSVLVLPMGYKIPSNVFKTKLIKRYRNVYRTST